MNEKLKIKITKVNELWYAWYIEHIDKKIFKENPLKSFQIRDKNFHYYAKESYDNSIVEWTSAYGYKNYVIYLSINNIDKQPAFIKKDLVEDFEKAIEWINNNIE